MTYDRYKKLNSVNVFLIDAYYETPQIVLFKSTSSIKAKKINDVVIKTIFYKSDTAYQEIRCLMQFPDMMQIYSLDFHEEEEDDSQKDESSSETEEEGEVE